MVHFWNIYTGGTLFATFSPVCNFDLNVFNSSVPYSQCFKTTSKIGKVKCMSVCFSPRIALRPWHLSPGIPDSSLLTRQVCYGCGYFQSWWTVHSAHIYRVTFGPPWSYASTDLPSPWFVLGVPTLGSYEWANWRWFTGLLDVSFVVLALFPGRSQHYKPRWR